MPKVDYDTLTEWEKSAVDRGVMKLPEKEFDPQRDGQKLAGMIEEALVAKSNVELYNGAIKDIRNRAKEELGLKPAQFTKLLNIHFKRNRDEVENENEELMDLYDKAFFKEQNKD